MARIYARICMPDKYEAEQADLLRRFCQEGDEDDMVTNADFEEFIRQNASKGFIRAYESYSKEVEKYQNLIQEA